MDELKIKVCGMKDPDNIRSVSELKPDLVGFILYRNSPRYVDADSLPRLIRCVSHGIRKTGVLVNEPIANAIKLAGSGYFDLLQLHGDESPAYCRKLSQYAPLVKAFHVSDSFPPGIEEYMPFCEMFLFDTAGANYGGTGKKFDHSILSEYNLDKNFILSGGISVTDADAIKFSGFKKMAAVDMNSLFEISPGKKDIRLLKEFIDKIRSK